LPIKDLLTCSTSLLTENGKAAFIIPADAYEKWKVEAAEQNLYPTYTTWVKSSEGLAPHRVMIAFSRCKSDEIIYNEISIYSSKNMYSQEYKELTSDFYLKF